MEVDRVDVPAEVRRHYEKQFGPPTRTADFVRRGDHYEVLKWAEDSTTEGVTLYATIGASRFPMDPSEPHHRFEVFTGFKPSNDDIAGSLALLAAVSRFEGKTIGHGHTVTFPEPLWPNTEMHTYLLLLQVSEVVPALRLDGGFHVEFLQAIPIYVSELAFKSAHGAEALLKSWESAQVPFWDPDRSPSPAGPAAGA